MSDSSSDIVDNPETPVSGVSKGAEIDGSKPKPKYDPRVNLPIPGPGAPLKFQSPQELRAKVDEYFAKEGKKSVMGLCVWLDTNRETLLDYQGRDAYSDIVLRAKRRIQQYYEELGQEPRTGHFVDRMITRMGWPCVEQQVNVNVPADLSGDECADLRRQMRHVVSTVVPQPQLPDVASDATKQPVSTPQEGKSQP